MSDDENHPPKPNVRPVKAVTGQTLAVAIAGELGRTGGTPRVIASGRGKVADEILKLAFDKGIKVREDADLAEILTRLDLDTPIPSEAIIAVAEILARVYAENSRMIRQEGEKE